VAARELEHASCVILLTPLRICGSFMWTVRGVTEGIPVIGGEEASACHRSGMLGADGAPAVDAGE